MKLQRQNWSGCKISGYAAVSRTKPCRFSSAPEKTAGHSGGMGRHHLDHDGGKGNRPSGREHYFCVLQWKGDYSRGVMAPLFSVLPEPIIVEEYPESPPNAPFRKKIAHPPTRCGIRMGVQLWWRRRESNPRPKTYPLSFLRVQTAY